MSRMLKKIRRAGRLPRLAAVSSVLWLAGCETSDDPVNAPLSEPRTSLLQTAFDTASAIPVQPHLDCRSKAQKRVFDGAVALGQMATAKQFAEQIGDWRRGVAHADLAYYFAERNKTAAARRELETAEEIATAIQDWPRDRIFARMAQTAVLLEDPGATQRYTAGIDGQEAAKATQTEAMACPEDQYDLQKETLLALLRHERYDHRKQGILSSTALFARFYPDPGKREEAAGMIRGHWAGFDSGFKVQTLSSMCEPAFLHGDFPYARTLLREGLEILDRAPLHPRQQIPLLAQLAGLAFRAGDPDGAQEMAARAESLYRERIDWIVNIYRPETLVALAEAQGVMGGADMALQTFRRAVEACIENPNSRPRAENLSLVCTSMAVGGTDPDAALWRRIGEIRADLGDPW